LKLAGPGIGEERKIFAINSAFSLRNARFLRFPIDVLSQNVVS
jgi:hypothetical protein